jgi:flagellar biosynthesis/type III secretory pathway chaperone
MQISEMMDHVRELMTVLQAETAVYRGLLAVAIREREDVRRSRAEAIRSAAADRQGLLDRLQSLETRRCRVVETLAVAWACRPEEVTVSRLAARLPDGLRANLVRCRDELVGVTERFRLENRRTALLLEHAGELLQSSYRVLKGLAARCGPVYRRGGQVQGARLHGKLVCSDI